MDSDCHTYPSEAPSTNLLSLSSCSLNCFSENPHQAVHWECKCELEINQQAMSDPSVDMVVDLDKDLDASPGAQVVEGEAGAQAAGLESLDAVAVATASHCKPPLPKPSRQTSKAWDCFERFKLDGKPAVRCRYCGKVYGGFTNKNGTSTILGHSRTCDKNPENANKDGKGTQSKIPFRSVEKGNEATASLQFDQSQSRDDLAEMLVLDELPFSHVEGKGFRKFVKGLRPEFKIPARQTATKDVFKLYEDEKQKLYDYFRIHNPRVCLTTDTWTSNQQINYMCLTGHYVDEQWVLRKKILNFCPILGHSGVEIGQGIESCLLSWGIKNVMTITVDNASSNDTALTYLSRKLNLSGSTILGGRFMHMRCIAHIINLIVQDGIGMMGVAVERVRVAVRYIKVSPSRLKVFKSCVKAVGITSKKLLCLDVTTRWNSTFLMLKAACRLEKAFEKFETKDRGLKLEMEERKRKDGSGERLGMLTFLDWAEVKSFMDFLEMFYDMTVRVSGSSYATSHTILDDICDISHSIRGGQESDNVDMQNMANKMRVKYDKYFGNIEKMNLYIFLAPIFDPRNKLGYVNYSIGQIYNPNVSPNVITHVQRTLDEFFAEYLQKYGSSVEPTSQPSSSVSAVGNPLKGFNQASYKRLRTSQDGTVKSELERYLTEDVEEDSTSFDVLHWWSKNGHRYPVIARMARDILAIPISTVSSESAFSGGGRILTNFRSQMTPFLVQCLICTQDWLKDAPFLLQTEEDLELLQTLEEELWESAKPEGLPQDM